MIALLATLPANSATQAVSIALDKFRSGYGAIAGRQQLASCTVRFLLHSSALTGEEALEERNLHSKKCCMLLTALLLAIHGNMAGLSI